MGRRYRAGEVRPGHHASRARVLSSRRTFLSGFDSRHSPLRLSLRSKQKNVQIADHRQYERMMDPDAVSNEALRQGDDSPAHLFMRSSHYWVWHHS